MANSDATLKFDAKDRVESLFSNEKGSYPTQLEEAPNEAKGGEFRGYYPGQIGQNGQPIGTWKPKSSHRGGRSGGGHNGADIYTGYAPFPLETPVRAATCGTFVPMSDAASPDEAGNRAAISTEIGKNRIDFRYGHLSRFARAAGKVNKGDIIGYAGCSGNADTAGECSEVGPCGLTSCHVHLITAVNGNFKTPPDPIAMLGWSLDYGPGADAEQKCAEIMPQAQVFEPTRTQGALKTDKSSHRRSKNGRRQPVAEPFANIIFDDAKRLTASLAAYDNLKSRLASGEVKHSKSGATFGAELLAHMADTWIGQLQQAINEPRTVHGRAIAVLDAEILLLRANGGEKGLGGPVSRALLAAARALWLLTGGAAILAGMSNRTLFDLWDTSGVAGFREKYPKRSNNPLYKFAQDKSKRPDKEGKYPNIAPPECGLGVGGWAVLVASDHAQVGFHLTTLNVIVPGGSTATDEVAVALDFSTLGMMQSIWPAHLYKTVPDGNGGGKPAKEFCIAVSDCLNHFRSAYCAASRLSGALSLADPADARRKKAAEQVADDLSKLRETISRTVAGYLSLDGLDEEGVKTRRAQVGKLLSTLVAFNEVLVSAAIVESGKKELAQPIAPRLHFLQLDGGKGGEDA